MTFEQEFLKRRKEYLDIVKKKDASKDFIDTIEHKLIKGFVKKLDQLKGKPAPEMDFAANAFEANRLIHIKAMMKVAGNLRSSVPKYGEALRHVGELFERAIEAQREAERPPAPPPMPKAKAPAGKPTGGGAAAAEAVKGMLGKVSEGYRKHRQGQLDMTIELEKHCMGQRNQIGVLVDTLQKGVKQAAAHSEGGRLREAEGLKVAAQGHVNRINAMSAGVKKKCHDSLEPFFKDRNLKAEVIAKKLHIDLPDEHVKELTKIPAVHGRILNNANARADAAGDLAEECQKMAEHAADLQSQIAGIAGGKDIVKLFLDGAANMSARVKASLDKAIQEAKTLQTVMIPGLAKNVKIVEDKAPADRVSAAQAYVNNSTRLVKLSMDKCAGAQTTAGKLIAAEKDKIPPQILRRPVVGQVIQESEALLKELVALHAGNTKTATAVLASADKLAK